MSYNFTFSTNSIMSYTIETANYFFMKYLSHLSPFSTIHKYTAQYIRHIARVQKGDKGDTSVT
ncbi:hypothetical protein SAMN05444362_10622 [Dysgonomonas macrotermitis]|uniref:Uncharacterized protein n=1 Tax=Dysgonomonas macrotermitis TaxID=1346286 RepID=A0A1M5BD06_9BACT|nr:hypothetical protein SAMN05444362_10622 [Dysgonomonas macrotermitis]